MLGRAEHGRDIGPFLRRPASTHLLPAEYDCRSPACGRYADAGGAGVLHRGFHPQPLHDGDRRGNQRRLGRAGELDFRRARDDPSVTLHIHNGHDAVAVRGEETLHPLEPRVLWRESSEHQVARRLHAGCADRRRGGEERGGGRGAGGTWSRYSIAVSPRAMGDAVVLTARQCRDVVQHGNEENGAARAARDATDDAGPRALLQRHALQPDVAHPASHQARACSLEPPRCLAPGEREEHLRHLLPVRGDVQERRLHGLVLQRAVQHDALAAREVARRSLGRQAGRGEEQLGRDRGRGNLVAVELRADCRTHSSSFQRVGDIINNSEPNCIPPRSRKRVPVLSSGKGGWRECQARAANGTGRPRRCLSNSR